MKFNYNPGRNTIFTLPFVTCCCNGYYLIGKTKMELDKQALKRLEDISQLPEENRKFILNLLDMALRDFKVKKSHNQ